MKLYTIEDLKNGVCAVKNDGTVEELNEVLQLAFPNSRIALGEALFYSKEITEWMTSNTQFFYQSVKLFLQLKMYTIEEIKSSKIAILVESERDADYLRSINCYGHIPKKPNFIYPYGTNPKEDKWDQNISYYNNNNYTIININQIITPNMKKEQEIFGYSLVKIEYNDAAIQLAGISNINWLGFKQKQFNIELDNYFKYIKNLKIAGVLDLWFKPVYKTQEKVYTLGIDGKFEIVVRDKKAFYDNEDVTSTLLELQHKCKRNFDTQIGRYTWNFDGETTVNSVGCISYKSLLSEWLAIDLT